MKAYAKINLLLEVIGKRENNYHDLCMINCSIDLFDEIFIESDSFFSFQIISELAHETENLPVDEKNLAVKALNKFCSLEGKEPNYKVILHKRIPIGAGLAGGSTDAAAVLNLLGKKQKSLSEIALSLGADIPFCLNGKPAVVRGIGEILEPFKIKSQLNFLIVNPGFSVSTKKIFDAFNLQHKNKKSRSEDLKRSLETGDIAAVGKLLHNDLEPITSKLYPEVIRALDAIRSTNPLGAIMSGSGPTVFGLYESKGAAESACKKLNGNFPIVMVAASVIPQEEL